LARWIMSKKDAPAPATMTSKPPLGGADIAEIMSSRGPVVQCVVLRCGTGDDAAADPAGSGGGAEEGSEPAAAVGGGEGGNPGDGHETPAGPVRAVLTDRIDQIEIDTTPSKSMVAKTLGGPFTFLGQYHDEGVVVMARNLPDDLEVQVMERVGAGDDNGDRKGGNADEEATCRAVTKTPEELRELLSRHLKVQELKELCREREIPTDGMLEKADVVEALVRYQGSLPPYNPHRLQPPLHRVRVRGDILILRVAETEEEYDDNDDDEVEAGEEEGNDEEDAAEDDDAADGGQNEEEKEEEDGNDEAEGDNVQREVADEGDDEEEPAEDDDAADGGQNEEEKEEEDGNDEAEGDDDVQREGADEGDADEAAGAGDEVEDDADGAKEASVLSNDEFFLDYTRDEYISFASRTDIPEHEVRYGGAEGDDNDDDDDDEGGPVRVGGAEGGEEVEEEDKSAVFNIVMQEVLRQYREENGRGPNTQELLELRANIARELDFHVADVMDGDWDKKAKGGSPTSERTRIISFHGQDRVKEYVPDENEYNYDVDPDGAMPGIDEEGEEEDDDDEDYPEPPAKRAKLSQPEDEEEEDSKPAARGP
jgi:hypothetical protein